MGNCYSRGCFCLIFCIVICIVFELEYYYKDVCLFLSFDYNQVLRGLVKVLLVENGFYVDVFKFDKMWSEVRFCSELVNLFEYVMKCLGWYIV